MNLKYQLQRGITYLNYFTDHILYQIFKITLNIDYFQYILKKYGEKTDNPSINIYSKKMENRITLKIKTGYYLEHLTTETMKLLGGTKSQITKDENGENVPHLEITNVVLVYCNIVNNHYEHDSGVLNTVTSNKSFGQLLDISPKIFIFLKTFISEF